MADEKKQTEILLEDIEIEKNDDVYSLAQDTNEILTPEETSEQEKQKTKGPGFFKRHKKLWKSLAVIIILLSILRFFLPELTVYAVNKYGPDILETDVSLGEVELGLLKGDIRLKDLKVGKPDGLQGKQFASVSLLEFNFWKGNVIVGGLTVANPKKFRDKNTLTLNELDVKLKMSSLFSDKLVIQNITVDGLDFYFEPVSKGKNNIETLMDYIAKTFQKGSEKEAEDDKEKEESGVQIDSISLKNITLHARPLQEKVSLGQGMTVWAKKINIFLEKGEADAENITITNPDGYFETHILTLKQIKAVLDIESFSQEKLIIKQFHIDDLDFYFEASAANGNTNVGELKAYINTLSKPDTGNKKDEDESEDETKLQIDNLSLTNIDVHTVIVKQKATLPIPNIVQKDLGDSPEGITGTEVFLIVLEELANGAALVVGGNAKKFGNDVKTNATKTIEQGTNGIKTQLDRLRSLFE